MLDQEQTEKLEARARRGEVKAFTALMRSLDHDLRGVVWSVVLSADTTDRVMTQVYATAFRSIGSVDEAAELKPWLLSICYDAAIRHERDVTEDDRDTASEADLDGGAFARLSASAAPEPDRAAIDDQLEALDPDQRGLIMLTMGMGYGFDETAAIVNMERSVVAAKAHQARLSLAEGRAR